MSSTNTASFDTRRAADMAIERLVQECGIERTDIFVTTEGADNSVGTEQAGADEQAGSPSPENRDDSALGGRILVSVDIQDDAIAAKVTEAFREFDGVVGAER